MNLDDVDFQDYTIELLQYSPTKKILPLKGIVDYYDLTKNGIEGELRDSTAEVSFLIPVKSIRALEYKHLLFDLFHYSLTQQTEIDFFGTFDPLTVTYTLSQLENTIQDNLLKRTNDFLK